MGKKISEKTAPGVWKKCVAPGLALVFFLGTCLSSGSVNKLLAMVLIAAAVASCLLRLSYVRERLSLPMLAVALWMLMNGISMFYAVSGLFALRAFLSLVIGFCVFLLVLAWSRRGEGSGRAAASVLAGGTALASLVSIDMLSTHWLSGPWVAFLSLISGGAPGVNTVPVEAGVRMLSLYENPNVFAGIAGLGVLLSLGLAVSAEGLGERRFHQSCLFLNALAFVLAFSMGASGMIVIAFLVLLLAEEKQRRGKLFLLMAETLVITLVCAFPVFFTAFDAWDGVQPIPLLCAVLGAAALCLVDQFVGRRLAEALEGKGKALGIVMAAGLALMVVYGALAVTVTGPAEFAAAPLRRAGYLAPGSYTLSVDADAPVSVVIESQDRQQTMMHTSTVLYWADASGCVFTVPEGSEVVYFNFYGVEGSTLRSAVYEGAESGSLKLGYKLIPGFVANRLQGLLANQNAIQRTVFFADGMKLFRRSPIIGLGVGAFENGILGVQSFFYETKYAHNHYVETLATTGVVGLILFVGMLALCAAALWTNLRRKEDADPLAPALLAALAFMALHAGVEIVFSVCYYLPLALGTLGLICLCCGKELPLPVEKQEIRSGIVVGLCVPLVIFAVLLGLNMRMEKMMDDGDYGDPYAALEQAATLDVFDSNSYKVSYVLAARDADPVSNSKIRSKADEYAVELAKEDSNSIPLYLADYYFATGRAERAVEMLEKIVDYAAADSRIWQDALGMLEFYSDDTAVFREGAARLYQKLQKWDGENIGAITLTAENQAFIDRMAALG